MQYREEVIDHARQPRNRGEVKGASHQARAVNASCGDEMEISMKVEEGKIERIAFEGEGCALAIAAASMLTEEVKGRKLEEVEKIGREVVERLEKEVSPGRLRCVRLAGEALKKALASGYNAK